MFEVKPDIIVIIVGNLHEVMLQYPSVDIWVAFGMGRNFHFYSVNKICTILGQSRSEALPVFHAITGCDQISGFNGKGKKSTWKAWNIFEEITNTFMYIARHPFELLHKDSPQFQSLERFIVIMYDSTSPLTSINEVRMELFCHRSCSMEKLPPTQIRLHSETYQIIVEYGG